MNFIIPSVGVPRDLELILDSGTIGKYFSRASETFLLVGVIFSVPVWPYSISIMLEAINEGHDSRAAALLEYIKQAFARVDKNTQIDFAKWLSNRVAIACGDGKLCWRIHGRTRASPCAFLNAAI